MLILKINASVSNIHAPVTKAETVEASGKKLLPSCMIFILNKTHEAYEKIFTASSMFNHGCGIFCPTNHCRQSD
jgi:hypothetical protein